MFAECGISLVCGGVLGYMGFMLTTLVYSIQAIAHDSDSTCTVSSFKWIYWICVSSALFAYGTFLGATQKREGKATIARYGVQLFLIWLMSLGMAIGTQVQYLDGCDNKAHTTMAIYMWGNYAVALCIPLCMACFALDEFWQRRTPVPPPPIPGDEPKAPYANPPGEV